jgi:two-component system, OmpR family, response regulator
MKILLVEDDVELGLLIVDGLKFRGFLVDLVDTIDSAYAVIADKDYRVAIFDRMLPDGDGLALTSNLRKMKNALPILMLTAIGGVSSRIEGLEAGADDYLEKPFDMNELAARLHALGRRPRDIATATLKAGRINFDMKSRMANTAQGAIKLSKREAALLEQFMRRLNVTVLREQLEQAVYGINDEITPNALEAHISRLRKKLKAADSGLTLHAMTGIGYLLAETV